MSNAWQLFCFREAVPLLRRPSPEGENVRYPLSTEFQTHLRTENFVLQLYPSTEYERRKANRWIVNLDSRTLRWLDELLHCWDVGQPDSSLRALLEQQSQTNRDRLGALFQLICAGAYSVQHRVDPRTGGH